MAEQLPVKPTPQRGRPKRPQGIQRVHVLTLRVPEELLRRLDAHRARVQAAYPYLRLSRADVIRTLLDTGLRVAAAQGKTGKTSSIEKG